MSAASENLKTNQRQLDADGCEVGVSRQAVEETLEQHNAMRAALEPFVKIINECDAEPKKLGSKINIAAMLPFLLAARDASKLSE